MNRRVFEVSMVGCLIWPLMVVSTHAGVDPGSTGGDAEHTSALSAPAALRGTSQIYTWNVADGPWGDPNSWTPVGVPSSTGDTAVIDNGGTVHVNGSYSYGDTQLDAGTIDLDTASSTLTSTDFSIGESGLSAVIMSSVDAGLSGLLTLGNDGTIQVTGGTLTHGSGSLTTAAGSTIDVSGLGSGFVAQSSSIVTEGTLTAANGTTIVIEAPWNHDGSASFNDASLETEQAGCAIGFDGTGTAVLSGSDAYWTSAVVRIGDNAGSQGSVSLLNGATLDIPNHWIVIGHDGNGELTIDGTGSQLLYTASNTIFIGSGYAASSATGTVTVSNGGTLYMSQGDLFVGHKSVGTMIIDGVGSSVSSAWISIAQQPGSQGSIEIRNGGSLLVYEHEVTIGEWGTGSLSVDGPDSSASLDTGVDIGLYASSEGTLTVSNGAQVEGTSGGPSLRLGNQGTGHVVVDGAGSQLSGGSLSVLNGDVAVSAGGALVMNNLEIRGDGLTVDGSGSTVTCNGDLIEVRSSMTVQGNGTVQGSARLWNRGNMAITDSTVQLDNTGANDGAIDLDSSSLNLTGDLECEGTITLEQSTLQAATLAVGANGVLVDQGTGGNRIELSGSFINQSRDNTVWNTRSTTVQLDGGARTTQALEAASRDLGQVTAAYVKNFAVGGLHVGPAATYVSLLDDSDNSPGTEAVYVEDLILESGTTLDLNGINLYYVNLDDYGATIILNGGELIPVTLCTTPSGPDCNENTVPDDCDIDEGYSLDVDENDIPDECGDCNSNGVLDYQEVAEGSADDCNSNRLPDECDIDWNLSEDCNLNEVPDECDLSVWTLPQLYWVSGGFDSIRRANMDGSGVEDVITAVQLANAVVVDHAEGMVYWSDGFPHNDIWRAYSDGSGVEHIVPDAGGPVSLALDGAGQIYWTCDDRIRRASVDGGPMTDLIVGLNDPQGIALDMISSKLYWTDGSSRLIKRANLDGSNVETVLGEQDNIERSFALDAGGGKMYWTASAGGGSSSPRVLRRANLDGSEVEDLADGLVNPIGLGLDLLGQKAYWADRSLNRIQRADLGGSSVDDVITTGLSDPRMLTVAAHLGSADCNENRTPDDCDLASGTSTDVNGNGILDECDCAAIEPLQSDLPVMAKNRYLSFISANADKQTAIRVNFADLPPPFDSANGRTMWVGPPQEVCENAGQDTPPPEGCGPAPGLPNPTFVGAPLECQPHYTDWSTYAAVHVYHAGMIPSSVYEVQAIDEVCGSPAENEYSAPLEITTSLWGDVVKNCITDPCGPPDGVVGIPTDVTAVLDKFKNLGGAPTKARCDIEPSQPDLRINIADVTNVLDAFRGFPYPFPMPEECP